LLFVTLASGTARAQPSNEPHFVRGVELYDRRQYAEALLEFQASRAVRDTASVARNMGLCLRAMSRYVEAIAELRRYLELGGDRVPAETRVEIERVVEALEARTTALTVRADPAGAAILVDGRPIAEWPVRLDPGREIAIEARLEGHRSATQAVRATTPGPMEVVLTLQPAPRLEVPARPPPPAPPVPRVRPGRPRESGDSAWPWILGAGVLVVGAGIGAVLLFEPFREEPLPGDLRMELP
jgi:hypothetical protein